MHKHRHLFKDEEEWQHFLKLGAALHDPAEKKEFYAAVIEGKQRDPLFEITGYVPRKASIPAQIISQLKESNRKKEEKVMPEAPRNKELENLAELFGKCIEKGLHLKSDKEAS